MVLRGTPQLSPVQFYFALCIMHPKLLLSNLRNWKQKKTFQLSHEKLLTWRYVAVYYLSLFSSFPSSHTHSEKYATNDFCTLLYREGEVVSVPYLLHQREVL